MQEGNSLSFQRVTHLNSLNFVIGKHQGIKIMVGGEISE
jgi:hypothetical protein